MRTLIYQLFDINKVRKLGIRNVQTMKIVTQSLYCQSNVR